MVATGAVLAEVLAAPDSAEARALLDEHGRAFMQGEVLFREGEPADAVYLLKTGRVRLLKRMQMVDRSVAVLAAGDLLGEGALIDGAVRTTTAVTLSEGALLALDRSSFYALGRYVSAFSEVVLTQLVKRLRDAEDQVEVLMLRDTQSKVVAALLKMARGTSGAVDLVVSPVELSSRVGLDVETVKRTVQRLREQRYVTIVGESVQIPDLEALRHLYGLLGAKEQLRGEH